MEQLIFLATPLGSLPFIEFEGKRLPQSMAIARHLAREFGLGGKNNVEQAQVDALIDTIQEAYEPLFKLLGAIMKGGKVSYLKYLKHITN